MHILLQIVMTRNHFFVCLLLPDHVLDFPERLDLEVIVNEFICKKSNNDTVRTWQKQLLFEI